MLYSPPELALAYAPPHSLHCPDAPVAMVQADARPPALLACAPLAMVLLFLTLERVWCATETSIATPDLWYFDSFIS